MPRELKSYTITAHVVRGVDSNASQVRYGVAAASRAAALRAFDAVRLTFGVAFFKDYGSEQDLRGWTEPLGQAPDVVHYQSLDTRSNREPWTPVQR